MPRKVRKYEVEILVSGYVTIEVEACAEEQARRKASKEFFALAIRGPSLKHGPIINDEFLEAGDMLVEEVEE
jgi:hypothetical protein